jgi:iron complex transport system substrate-binding protein
MLETAGGVNVFADIDREAVQPSSEMLLIRAPEVVLELRAEGFSRDRLDAERAAWGALASVPAVRHDRIHFLGGDYLVVPGPRVGQATRALARALHPEAYR